MYAVSSIQGVIPVEVYYFIYYFNLEKGHTVQFSLVLRFCAT